MKTLMNPVPATTLNNTQMVDADLPNANAVMAAICCASAQFSVNPSLDLALLIEDLAYTLGAPAYAESPFIEEVAARLMTQWSQIVDATEASMLDEMPSTQNMH